MAFGQAAGPPANARQVEELAALLSANGYDSFREARHPFGLTQRQANGKFTIDEAGALLERLEAMSTVSSSAEESAVADASHVSGAKVPSSPAAKSKAEQRRRDRDAETVAALDAEVLADELSRRGWCCIPPD